MSTTALLTIIVLALLGVLVCGYIFVKKRRKESLVCFIGEECSVIIYSRYSMVLGVPLELIGAVYYLGVALLAALALLDIQTIWLFTTVMLLYATGIIGAFFSLVFLYVQFGILKAACDYCLASAALSIAIFFD